MRPDAMAFTPRHSSSTSGSFDADSLAIVPVGNGAPNGDHTNTALHALIDNLYTEDVKASPREMVMHESIKGLLGSVAALQARCSGLEAANTELKEALEVVQSRAASCDSSTMANGNLTGYACSECGSEGERGRSRPKHETTEKLRMQEEILTILYGEIQKQATQQQELDKRFERTGYDQTALKGRVGTLEKALKELKADFEDASTQDKASALSSNSASEVGAYLNDELQKAQIRLTKLEHGLNEKWAELDSRCETLTVAVQTGVAEPIAVGYQTFGSVNSSDDMSGKAPKASKENIVDLKNWQSAIRRQMKNISVIDEAHMRDTLYGMFFHSTHIMEKASGTATVWSEGPFEATADKGFALRARVVRRLAMLDLCEAAFKEAQSKWGEVDY